VLQAAYVPYAVTLIGLDAAAIGSTLATYGASLVVGALFTTRLMRAMPRVGAVPHRQRRLATLGAALGAGIAARVGGSLGLKTCIGVTALGFAAQALIIVVSPLLRLRALPAAVT